MLAYLGFFRPFVETSMNVIYIFDEIILLAITCLLLTFEASSREDGSGAVSYKINNVGYGIVALIILHILGHITWQCYQTFKVWKYRLWLRNKHKVVRELRQTSSFTTNKTMLVPDETARSAVETERAAEEVKKLEEANKELFGPSDPYNSGRGLVCDVAERLPTIKETGESWHTDNWSIINETVS